MIDGGHSVSVLGRHGPWVAQLLPVALLRMGASLESVLSGHSLSCIAFKLRDRRDALALPLSLTAGFHLMPYIGVSELDQGCRSPCGSGPSWRPGRSHVLPLTPR